MTAELKQHHADVSQRESFFFSIRHWPCCFRTQTATKCEAGVQVARANFEYAGVSSKIDILVGPAAQTLPNLEPSFDLVFIDADKPSNLIYYKEARRLTTKGGVIVRTHFLTKKTVVLRA